MEQLPFGDGSFAAICSQFGIEYADETRAIPEVARVAAEGAIFRFVIHDSSASIVAQSKSRGEALSWALRESGCFEVAERLISARAVALLPVPPALGNAIGVAREKFPREPVACEVMLALNHVLSARGSASPSDAGQQLLRLREQAASELATLDALQRSARDEEAIAALAGLLRENAATVDEPKRLVEPGSRSPFAWVLEGRLS